MSIASGGHRSQDVGGSAPATHRVAIESRHLRRRPEAGNLGGDPLGAKSATFEIWALARRARLRDQDAVVAVVAAGTMTVPLLRNARSATRCSSDTRAFHHTDGRRLRSQDLVDSTGSATAALPRACLAIAFFNRPLRITSGPCSAYSSPHVDDGHSGKRAILHAPLHQQARVAPALPRSGCSRATGVAEPSTTSAPSCLPRITATSRPLYRGVSSCLNDVSCSSSTMISPRFVSGANTAERVPTTIETSPRRMRYHWSDRSPSDKPAMLHGHSIAECRAKCGRHRGRQRNFRHEHEHRLSTVAARRSERRR